MIFWCQVGPQAIYVVDRDDDAESIAAGSEISDDDAASWETVQDDDMDALENAEEVHLCLQQNYDCALIYLI